MTFILVAAMFAALIAADWYMERRRAARADGAVALPTRQRAVSTLIPRVAPAYFVHPGHAWVSIEPDGDARIGTSEFASNFAGDLSRVELPPEGASLRSGQPAWTLVSDRDRRLTQVMPIEGTVVAVNRKLARDPMLVQRSSLDDGWILRVRPTHLRESLGNLFAGALAEAWNEATRARLTATMGSEIGRLANDGGVWFAGFGDMMDDDSWQALKHDLFPATEETSVTSRAGRQR